MRIAQDVINRIKYDPDLPTEAFVVGYEDRFVGIKEKSFTAFKWEDLAMVDDRAGDLAIPQHRVQYFKYRGHIVWDKRGVRRDDFFGSTAGGRTIHEVMRDHTLVPTCSRCTEGVPHTRTPSCTAGTAAADTRKGKNGRKQGSRRHGGGRGGSYGPRKTLPSGGGGGVGGGGGGEGKDGGGGGDDDNGNNEYGAKNDRANYFVSVRVMASNVRDGIVRFV